VRSGGSRPISAIARDVTRKIGGNTVLEQRFAAILYRVERVLAQQRHDRNKLYALHVPEVECLAKGKAHKKYEFGVKVSIAATNRSGVVLGMLALPGNPYDGHTLDAAARQAERLTGTSIERLYVDRGYRGRNCPHLDRTVISGQYEIARS
jgi:transposase, IS5 family